MPMKKLMIFATFFAVLVASSCKKDSVVIPTKSTKWTMGTGGKTDTTLAIKPSQAGKLILKVNQYGLCPTDVVGVTIKVNNEAVLQENWYVLKTEGFSFPVKANDNVSIQTKLVPTGGKIACITLGSADFELVE
jgi:hypothetical protein